MSPLKTLNTTGINEKMPGSVSGDFHIVESWLSDFKSGLCHLEEYNEENYVSYLGCNLIFCKMHRKLQPESLSLYLGEVLEFSVTC